MISLRRALLVSSSLFIVACGSKPELPDAGSPDASVQTDAGAHDAGMHAVVTIDATGGFVQLDALQLTIGEGALAAATDVTVGLSTQTPRLADVTPLTPVFEFGPSGTQFATDVSVAFDVTPAQSGEVQLVYWTNAAGEFEPLPTWWSATGRVFARASHFSRAFVGRPVRAPASLTCGERMCLATAARDTLVVAADGGVASGSNFALRMSADFQPGTPRKVEVRETPVRPSDLGGASAGVVLDFKVSPFVTREQVELCFAVPQATDAGSACLAFFDEGRGRWVCEDECLSVRAAGAGGDRQVCGKTNHFTSFAVLLGGASSQRVCP